MPTVVCPHCQTNLPLADLPFANGLRNCPRCGEPLPPPVADPPSGPPQAAARREPGRRSPRLVAGMVLAVMALMAVLSLAVGLSTVALRRAHDLKPLGYLPEGTNVVGAIHVAKLMDEATGRDFLSQFHLGPDGIDFARLERAIGLPRDVMADVVLGLRVDDRPVPRLTLVVQTLSPYNPAEFLKGLGNPPPIERNQKKLYPFRIPASDLQAVAWCAGERTLVFGLSPEDLDDVPLTPRPGVGHLPAALQHFPGDLLAPKAQVWLIGHADHWDQTGVWPWLAPRLGDGRDAAGAVQTLGVWLRFDQSIAVSAAAHCRSESAATALREYLRNKGVDEKGRLQADANGWVTFQTQTGLATLRRWGEGHW